MASYNINSRLEENTRAAIIQQHLKSVPNHHIANRCQVSISVVSQAIKQYWEKKVPEGCFDVDAYQKTVFSI